MRPVRALAGGTIIPAAADKQTHSPCYCCMHGFHAATSIVYLTTKGSFSSTILSSTAVTFPEKLRGVQQPLELQC